MLLCIIITTCVTYIVYYRYDVCLVCMLSCVSNLISKSVSRIAHATTVVGSNGRLACCSSSCCCLADHRFPHLWTTIVWSKSWRPLIAGCLFLQRLGVDLPLNRPVWDSNPRPPASESRHFSQLSYRCSDGREGIAASLARSTLLGCGQLGSTLMGRFKSNEF